MDRIPLHSDIARIYPRPNIPSATRHSLERFFGISDANQIVPGDERERFNLSKIDDINERLGIVRTYCGDELNPTTYEAAALSDVVRAAFNKISKSESKKAMSVLADYLFNRQDDGDKRDNIYLIGLLQDSRRLFNIKSVTASQPKSIFVPKRPSQPEWLAEPEIASTSLINAVNSINIESFLIASSEILQLLEDEHAHNNRETLDNIRFSEQILAPIAYTMGFDVLDQSLRSRSNILRLRYGGMGEFIELARAILETIKNFDYHHNMSENTDQLVRNIIGSIYDINSHKIETRFPIKYGEENSSIYGDTKPFPVAIDNDAIKISLRFRLKSVGSIARKIHKGWAKNGSINTMPMDIIGITIVTEDEIDQKKCFKQLVRGLYSAKDIEPYPAPSKKSPVHIAGTASYIANLSEVVNDSIRISTKIAKDDKALHLCKVTAFCNKVPFEIQCVTKKYRSLMQRGEISHTFYKSTGNDDSSMAELVQLMDDIYKRRSILGDRGLVGSSFDSKTKSRIIGHNEKKAIGLRQDLQSIRSKTSKKSSKK